MQAQVTQETVCAGVLDRFLAILFDGFLLAIPYVALLMTVGPVTTYIMEFLLGATFSMFFWTSSGQTPGKRFLNLKVVSAQTGALLTPKEAFVRYIGTIISGIPLLLGYAWAIWDPKHEAWHDKIAGTKVIKV